MSEQIQAIARCRKPGPGWRHISGSVWDHIPSGMRVHGLGFVRMPDGRWINGTEWPEIIRFGLSVGLTGTTNMRHVMVWAMLVLNNVSVDHAMTDDRCEETAQTPVSSVRNAITDNAAQLAALGRRMEKAKREVGDE
jgi:hypothetical protein